MKKQVQKIHLSRETFALLTGSDLKTVVPGGAALSVHIKCTVLVNSCGQICP
jgi:hypothetical protein